MNDKIKKALAWIAGILGTVFAVLVGRWRNNADRKRISDATDNVAEGRRTVDDIRAGNQQIADTVEGFGNAVTELADGVRESEGTCERAGDAVADAHESVRRGIEILEQAEKRSKQK